jgi:hypothetical protein
LITDPQLINALIQVEGKRPKIMSPQVYAALPLGKDYTYENYRAEFPNRFPHSVCTKYEKNIVSGDNYDYYYIENCKKRIFDRYEDVQIFNVANHPIHAIAGFELALLAEGKPVVVRREEKDIKAIPEAELKKNLPRKEILCKNLNNKITAFHESFFYIEKCVLFPIKNFSVELQMKAQAQGGIKDLKIEQILGLEEGKEMTAAEVLKKLR